MNPKYQNQVNQKVQASWSVAARDALHRALSAPQGLWIKPWSIFAPVLGSPHLPLTLKETAKRKVGGAFLLRACPGQAISWSPQWEELRHL